MTRAMSDRDKRFRELRANGWTGPIDQDGNPVEILDRWVKDQQAAVSVAALSTLAAAVLGPIVQRHTLGGDS